MPSKKNKIIVFFDGYCGICNTFVDFAMKNNSKENLFYTPLQGETAKELLSEKQRLDLDTVVVSYYGETFVRSKAIFKVVRELDYPVRILNIFSFLPTFITDLGYKFIAKIRHKIMKPKDTCRMPTESERARFLD